MPKRLTMNDYQEIERERGGVCIHPYLPKRQEKVIWECKRGHRFAIRQDNVRAGVWCPICTSRRWDMKRLEEVMPVL